MIMASRPKAGRELWLLWAIMVGVIILIILVIVMRGGPIMPQVVATEETHGSGTLPLGPRLVHADEAKRHKANADIAEIKNALNRFRLQCDRFPTTAEGLDVLVDGAHIQHWRGPYLAKVVDDPWGTPYVYKDLGSDEISIKSLGSDGKPGGTDFAEDIGN